MIVWGSKANQRRTRHHRSSRVCEWSLHVCARVCWQLCCRACSTKTDTFIHISEAYIRLCFHRKKEKERDKHAYTCTCACLCPLQLNRISRVYDCALHVRVGVLILLIRQLLVSVCMHMYVRVSWCLYYLKVQYSLKQPRETHTLTQAMKARRKCRVTGQTAGCSLKQVTCIEEKQTVRQRSCRVYSEKQTNKKQIYVLTHAPMVCMFVCMLVWGARANQRHTRHHRSSRVSEWSLHAFVCVRWQVSYMLNKNQIRSNTLVKHTYDYVFTERKGKR